MELKYVGSRPVVSQYGVSFDESKPDNYTFISPVLDFLDALNNIENAQGVLDLTQMNIHEYKPKELSQNVHECCSSLDEIFDKREEETNQRIDEFIKDIEENQTLTKDEREALLGNIDFMREYYIHYITNEGIYRSLLHTLADRLHQLHCDDILFPIGQKHGLVISHLIPILRDYRPPYDATLTLQEQDNQRIGMISMNREKSII